MASTVWLEPNGWQAIFAGGTLFIAIVASGIGLTQLYQYLRQSREQTRPYVIVDFFFRQTIVCIVVQNIGHTPAANVTIHFEPELQSTHPDMAKAARAAIARPIPMMAPNRRIVWLLDSAITAFRDESVQHSYRVKIEYSDLDPQNRNFPFGRKRKAREYRDPEHVLDLHQYKGALIHDSTMWDLVTAVKDLKTDMVTAVKDLKTLE